MLQIFGRWESLDDFARGAAEFIARIPLSVGKAYSRSYVRAAPPDRSVRPGGQGESSHERVWILNLFADRCRARTVGGRKGHTYRAARVSVDRRAIWALSRHVVSGFEPRNSFRRHHRPKTERAGNGVGDSKPNRHYQRQRLGPRRWDRLLSGDRGKQGRL